MYRRGHPLLFTVLGLVTIAATLRGEAGTALLAFAGALWLWLR